MVDRVIDHLRRPEVPDIAHVVGQIVTSGRDDLPPYQVLFETLARETLFGAGQSLQPIDSSPRSAFGIDLAVLYEGLQVSIGHCRDTPIAWASRVPTRWPSFAINSRASVRILSLSWLIRVIVKKCLVF